MCRRQQVLCHSDALAGQSSRHMALSLVSLLVWAMMAIAPAGAASIGDRVSGFLTLGKKQIPLPTGEWTVAGVAPQPFSMPTLGAFGTIQTAVLFLRRDDRVDAVLEINANAIPVNDGWGRSKACAPSPQQLLLLTRYKTGW